MATIGTLFYLASQIHQNTRTARSSAYQAAAAAITTWSIEMSKDPVLLKNLTEGLYDPDALDEGARVQVGMQFQALFRNYENLFYQWRENAITDDVWRGWSRQVRVVFWTPGGQRWWPAWRMFCHEDFRTFLENSTPPEEKMVVGIPLAKD